MDLKYKWRVGDLVKIHTPGWEPLNDSYAPFSTGIVTAIDVVDSEDQLFLFPAITVYDFKARTETRFSSSSLEILSPAT